MSLLRIIFNIFVVLLFSAPFTSEASGVANFMLDESGSVIQMNLVTLSRQLAMDKSFPLRDTKRGLYLTDFKTGKTIAKFKPKKNDPVRLVFNAYALDADRIVLGSGAAIGIWKWKTGDLVVYPGTGSGGSGYGLQVSGVDPQERFILSSSPTYGHGLYVHDLKHGSSTQLFKEYEVMSPRFSPDGSRYAFFGRLNRAKVNEESFLIVQDLSSEERHVYQFDKGTHGVILSWSPSGKHIAGIISSHQGKSTLYIWNDLGGLVNVIRLPFLAASNWSPLWHRDEASISLFYRRDFSKRDEPIVQHTVAVRGYDIK